MSYREIIAVYYENYVKRMHVHHVLWRGVGGWVNNEIFVISLAVCVVTREF